jgi:hypothetical protein
MKYKFEFDKLCLVLNLKQPLNEIFHSKKGETKVIIIMKKLLVLLIFFSTSSCKNNLLNSNSELTILAGQSFGFCIGPCFQSITINGDKHDIKFYVKYVDSKGFQGTSNEETFEEQMDLKEWEAIISEVNFNSFKKLDKVYGCPDCADGGSEFIEIENKGEVHRVTFEYNKSIKGFEKLVQLLHDQRANLSKKYVD